MGTSTCTGGIGNKGYQEIPARKLALEPSLKKAGNKRAAEKTEKVIASATPTARAVQDEIKAALANISIEFSDGIPQFIYHDPLGKVLSPNAPAKVNMQPPVKGPLGLA